MHMFLIINNLRPRPGERIWDQRKKDVRQGKQRFGPKTLPPRHVDARRMAILCRGGKQIGRFAQKRCRLGARNALSGRFFAEAA